MHRRPGQPHIVPGADRKTGHDAHCRAHHGSTSAVRARIETAPRRSARGACSALAADRSSTATILSTTSRARPSGRLRNSVRHCVPRSPNRIASATAASASSFHLRAGGKEPHDAAAAGPVAQSSARPCARMGAAVSPSWSCRRYCRRQPAAPVPSISAAFRRPGASASSAAACCRCRPSRSRNGARARRGSGSRPCAAIHARLDNLLRVLKGAASCRRRREIRCAGALSRALASFRTASVRAAIEAARRPCRHHA